MHSRFVFVVFAVALFGIIPARSQERGLSTKAVERALTSFGDRSASTYFSRLDLAADVSSLLNDLHAVADIAREDGRGELSHHTELVVQILMDCEESMAVLHEVRLPGWLRDLGVHDEDFEHVRKTSSQLLSRAFRWIYKVVMPTQDKLALRDAFPEIMNVIHDDPEFKNIRRALWLLRLAKPNPVVRNLMAWGREHGIFDEALDRIPAALALQSLRSVVYEKGDEENTSFLGPTCRLIFSEARDWARERFWY